MVNLCSSDKDMEIRILPDGFIEIKGKIEYFSKSGTLFDKRKRAFFIEQIQSGAFSKCLDNQKEIPCLLFNHDWSYKNKVKSFDFSDSDSCFVFTYVVEASEKLIELLPSIKNFSFGFHVEEDEWKRVDGTTASYERTVKSFKAITEFSLLHGLESAYSCARVYIENRDMLLIDIEREEILQYMRECIGKIRRKEVEDLKKIVRSLKEGG